MQEQEREEGPASLVCCRAGEKRPKKDVKTTYRAICAQESLEVAGVLTTFAGTAAGGACAGGGAAGALVAAEGVCGVVPFNAAVSPPQVVGVLEPQAAASASASAASPLGAAGADASGAEASLGV